LDVIRLRIEVFEPGGAMPVFAHENIINVSGVLL
jgi:hypothetical protein